MTAKAAPFTLLVTHLHFDGSKAAATGDHVVKSSDEGSALILMGALAESNPNGLGVFVAQNFLDPGTGKRVALVGVHNENQVGEAVNEAASEFLFFVKALFDGAALCDINEGSLITEDVTGGIADDGGGIQAKERLAIFAAQSDFMALRMWLAMNFVSKLVALLVVNKNLCDMLAE